MTEVSRTSRGTEVPGTLPTISVAPTPVPYRVAKRTLDIMASSLGLIVSSPLLIAIAAAIRLESPGDVLFRQERVGLGGRPFRLYKFRTMHATADQETHRRHVEQLIRGKMILLCEGRVEDRQPLTGRAQTSLDEELAEFFTGGGNAHAGRLRPLPPACQFVRALAPSGAEVTA